MKGCRHWVTLIHFKNQREVGASGPLEGSRKAGHPGEEGRPLCVVEPLHGAAGRSKHDNVSEGVKRNVVPGTRESISQVNY